VVSSTHHPSMFWPEFGETMSRIGEMPSTLSTNGVVRQFNLHASPMDSGHPRTARTLRHHPRTAGLDDLIVVVKGKALADPR
jgi:hypothetical protein